VAFNTHSPRLRGGRLASANTPVPGQPAYRQYPTTTVERLLLLVTIVTLPLQDHLPTVAGFSVLYLMFAVLACYVMCERPRALTRTCQHPLFLTAFSMLIWAVIMEVTQPNRSFSLIFSIAQMFAGAIFVGAICRDRQALRWAVYGYIIVGIWMSVLLFLTSFGTLQGASALEFDEASQLRAQAFTDSPLHANLNAMAFIAAQGTVVALSVALFAKSPYRRNLLLGIALFCSIAAFLPMSRSGILTVGLSCAAVMIAYGINFRVIAIAAVLGASIVLWVPEAVFSRLTFSTEVREGKMEARARVYTAAVEHLPEYVMTGVGVGNFWGAWGMQSLYAAKTYVIGAHNCFIQATIYWGLPGLLALTVLVLQAYRCLPKGRGHDVLALSLYGVTVSLLFLSFVIHNLNAKEFSLGLGVLVGSRLWIWPQVIPRSPARQKRRFHLVSA
jgi:hypothetical protein